MKNSLAYYCLNIIVNISSFSPLHNNVNTTRMYCHKQALNKKLKMIRGAMKFFTKKLLENIYQKVFTSIIPLGYEIFFEKFIKSSNPPPTYLMYTAVSESDAVQ